MPMKLKIDVNPVKHDEIIDKLIEDYSTQIHAQKLAASNASSGEKLAATLNNEESDQSVSITPEEVWAAIETDLNRTLIVGQHVDPHIKAFTDIKQQIFQKMGGNK